MKTHVIWAILNTNPASCHGCVTCVWWFGRFLNKNGKRTVYKEEET